MNYEAEVVIVAEDVVKGRRHPWSSRRVAASVLSDLGAGNDAGERVRDIVDEEFVVLTGGGERGR